ncbi:unnamed protein product [Prorocentrum cordatum]|uniref:J domain-containing protein n=1 Tax=Prorocentrum cordatum TaxID=2364126 RepID=A0ABN9UZ52_9DINO|nr:unnamed protein product [Polarella glacialis]
MAPLLALPPLEPGQDPGPLIVCGCAPFAKKEVQNAGHAFFEAYERQAGDGTEDSADGDAQSPLAGDSPSGKKKRKEKKEREDALKLPDSLKGEDLYALLELDAGASQDDLKKAYRKMCLVHHPESPAWRATAAGAAAAAAAGAEGGAGGHFLLCPGPAGGENSVDAPYSCLDAPVPERSTPGECGQHEWRSWKDQPAWLATQVHAELRELRGVAPWALEEVAARWRESPPALDGAPVGLEAVAAFMQQLLGEDPFGGGPERVPWMDFGLGAGGSPAKAAAITHRQLAFVVANVLMGNDVEGGNALSEALVRCTAAAEARRAAGARGGLGYPGPQGHGSVLVAAAPREADGSWQRLVPGAVLREPGLCLQSEPSACVDFMAGGSAGQALTDIAGYAVGGGGGLCDVANSQDESLVIFYSEVLAFSFFSSQSQMLRVPWTLLGARRYMGSITGESRRGEASCGFIKREDWLNNAILRQTVPVVIADRVEQIAPSAFVTVFSKSSVQDAACSIEDAQNNQCDAQRRHLDADISLWVQAFHAPMYLPEVQEVFGSVVMRVGTGPWGAGLWFGDSQQYFLAVWLATALLGGPGLEYYVYDHFCENPGNQCFLHGRLCGVHRAWRHRCLRGVRRQLRRRQRARLGGSLPREAGRGSVPGPQERWAASQAGVRPPGGRRGAARAGGGGGESEADAAVRP